MSDIRARHPGLRQAVLADIRVALVHRSEHREIRSRTAAILQLLRLVWVSDAFFAQLLYRLKATGQRRGFPILPRLAHRLAMATGQVTIGDPVVVQPGLHLLHGQVVIDGLVEIGSGAVIGPFVTIGLRPAHRRPDHRGGRQHRDGGEGPGKGAGRRGSVDRGQRGGPRRRAAGGHCGRGPGAPDDGLAYEPMILRSRRKKELGQLAAEIESLTQSNRAHPDPETERRLVKDRHLLGLSLLEAARGKPDYPEPAFDRLPARNGDLPGIAPASSPRRWSGRNPPGWLPADSRAGRPWGRRGARE